MKTSYSFQVTSHLPIQNGAISTSCCGPSSSLAARLAVGAAHHELAAGDRHHVERDVGVGRDRRCRASFRLVLASASFASRFRDAALTAAASGTPANESNPR